MKTAGRENPNRWVTVPSTRVHGAEVQNRSRSITRAGKQEKLQPKEMCFFLTSPFIELLRTWRSRRRVIDSIRDLTEQTDDDQFFGAPRPAGAFGSGLSSGGNSSNTAFIAVTALACSAISLSASGVLELMSDTF